MGSDAGFCISGPGLAQCWGQDTFGRSTWGGLAWSGIANPVAKLAIGPDQDSYGRLYTGVCAVDSIGLLWCARRSADAFAKDTDFDTAHIQIQSVALGAKHFCALDRSRALYCWGDNSSHQVGAHASPNVTGAEKLTAITL
jgi:hypothetical protein